MIQRVDVWSVSFCPESRLLQGFLLRAGAFVLASAMIKRLSEAVFPKQARWPEKQTFQTAIIVSMIKARDE
ncbi:MAG: hypothetical protein SPE74_01880, partial [Oscillospiraceae bacterium]|nr:hypothetical protein [Oscillospiraceae bacterium]